MDQFNVIHEAAQQGLPAAALVCIFPFTQTLYFQQDTVFCLSVAGYNWGMGILSTVVLLHAHGRNG